MVMVTVNREQLLYRLNQYFSEEQIKTTARVSRALPPTSELGRLSEALGVIPKSEVKAWRQAIKRLPRIISSALNQGVRQHLRDVSRANFVGPKELRINIVDGENFEIRITQMGAHVEITLTTMTAASDRQKGE